MKKKYFIKTTAEFSGDPKLEEITGKEDITTRDYYVDLCSIESFNSTQEGEKTTVRFSSGDAITIDYNFNKFCMLIDRVFGIKS